MRKFLGNPALEAELQAADAEAVRRVALENLSLEEVSALVDEAGQCADEASADLAEVGRVTEVSDALEDLAVVASEIKDPTAGEQALMGTAAQMAVAGTDIAPEEVVPALEGYEDWKTKGGEFVEKVKQKAKEIWEKIMAFLRKIWGQIQEFFYRLFDSIPSLMKKLKAQQKDLLEAKAKHFDKAQAPKIKMNVGFAALTASNGTIGDGDEMAGGFTSLLSVCDYTFGKLASAVKARGEALSGAIGEFKWDAAMASCDKLVHVVHAHKLPLPTTQGRAVGQGEYTVTTTKGTLGGMVLSHKVVQDTALASANTLRKLELLRGEGVEISRGTTGSGITGAAYEVEVMPLEQTQKIVKDAISVLEKLEGWKKDGLKGLQETQKKLESASSKAAGWLSIGADKLNGVIPKDIDVAMYRGALNFNTAFTRWTSEPSVTLSRGALASVRALTILVDKSLSAYTVRGDALPHDTKVTDNKVHVTGAAAA